MTKKNHKILKEFIQVKSVKFKNITNKTNKNKEEEEEENHTTLSELSYKILHRWSMSCLRYDKMIYIYIYIIY